MEKNEKYIQQKREYNSKLSTFQISKELHKRVKEYCSKEKMKVRDFIENLLSNNIK
jgi:predicted HicB family RNase H-like nuclease